MSVKKVLVINIGWEQEPLIQLLHERGYELYGITNFRLKKPTLKKHFKKIFQFDFRDLENIYNIAKELKIDAVISDQCDYSHFAQSYVSERLGLKGSTLSQAQISINKYVQRKHAELNGILVPKFILVFNYDEAISACDEIGFPIIIKPIDNRGSFGVAKVNNLSELKYCYLNALSNSHSRFVLIEQFIDGYEITVDGYCFDGIPKSLTIAKKSKEGLGSQVSMDIKYPAEIPDYIYDKALVNNEFVNTILGFTFGMTHSEYMITNTGLIYLIESANRGGGVFTSEIIVPNVCGVNILEKYIDDVIGIKSKVIYPDQIEKNNVILKFFSFQPGVIKKISGFNEIKKNKGILKAKLNVKVGDQISVISNDGNRHGFIIFKSSEKIRNQVNEIINKIKINYE